ncbi:ACP S-malonyltransferase [Clostridium frigidicarnis]|uniref:[acyl-carrier-protein] S-malonyltransferase n=1 Tax=Clostridium frigidicarnis TaxID=84698 RepID=A0A1I1BAQ6_9CLOT|nr:ACP S-malonyltransferase [Clostridium frigidicarnis]SFB47439.1 [acyl-carrier-protein] S-malonyltransferase [Clostridium frigidicarnis]
MDNNALLFSGQGSQYVGMCKSICNNYSIAKHTFEEAGEVLGFDILKLCMEGDMSELSKTENTQPAILTVSTAMYRTYMSKGRVKPSFFAGHSLGEISALTCAGAIDFADAVKLVRERGRLMNLAADGNGIMIAVRDIDGEYIEDICRKNSKKDGIVVISNYNTNKEYVISGHTNSVKSAAEELKSIGARINVLKVSGGFHSPLMNEASDKFKEELKKYKFNDISIPVISNVTALPYKSATEIADLLPLQMIIPVYWKNSIEYIINHGVESFIEIGPNIILKKMVKKISPHVKSFSLDDDDDVNYLNNEEVLLIIKRCLANSICMQNYNWDNNQYNAGVVEPYRSVKKRFLEIKSTTNKKTTIDDVEKALGMLQSVLNTKKVPNDEKNRRTKDIFEGIECKQILNLQGKNKD